MNVEWVEGVLYGLCGRGGYWILGEGVEVGIVLAIFSFF